MENKARRSLPEERERAVRLFREVRNDYPTQWSALEAVAGKIGRTPETLRHWIHKAEVEEGKRPGTPDEIAAEVKRLKRENAELKRANEILKAASIFFGDASSTVQPRSSYVHRQISKS